MLSILCLKEEKGDTFRSITGLLDVLPGLLHLLDLTRGPLHDKSTVYKAMDRLTMALFRSLLQQTTSLQELGGVATIGASSFDRVASSRRNTTRTDYWFRSLKTTILVDCSTGALLDVHGATTKPHDTKIGLLVLQRNTDRITTITADKGYGWADFRSKLRDNGVRPVLITENLITLVRRTMPASTTVCITAGLSSRPSSECPNSATATDYAPAVGTASSASSRSNVPSKKVDSSLSTANP